MMDFSTDIKKNKYDPKANWMGFHPGVKVLLENPQRKEGISTQLTLGWEGSNPL